MSRPAQKKQNYTETGIPLGRIEHRRIQREKRIRQWTRRLRWLTGGCVLLAALGIYLYPIYQDVTQGAEVDNSEVALRALKTEEHVPSLNPKQRDKLAGAMRLEIRAIEMSGAILEEMTPENLDVALTKLTPDMRPGMGNLVIVGYRSFVPGRHFNRLSDVGIGAEVMIFDPLSKKSYDYVVEEKKTVSPEDVSIFDDAMKPTLTLITHARIETGRDDLYVVRATLVRTEIVERVDEE